MLQERILALGNGRLFALTLDAGMDHSPLAHADASGELKARWPRKKQFAVIMSGTTPPSPVSAFGHIGGETYVVDAASGGIDAVPPLLGLGKEDLATPRLSPSARYVATFKHYGGDRISVFDRRTRLVAALPLGPAGRKRAPARGGDGTQVLWADVHVEEDAVIVLLHLDAASRQAGIDDSDSQRLALWQQPEFQQAALEWRQLLQMDEGAQGWSWGDAGLMHWTAQREEFPAANFSTVWTMGVCH